MCRLIVSAVWTSSCRLIAYRGLRYGRLRSGPEEVVLGGERIGLGQVCWCSITWVAWDGEASGSDKEG